MAGKEVIDVPELAETRGYSYESCIRVGDWVYIAGQGPLDENGEVVSLEFGEQTRKVFENIEYAVEAAGGSLGDLVHMTAFITDWRYGRVFTELRGEILGDELTTSSLIGVDSFAYPEMLVEVEAQAYVPVE